MNRVEFMKQLESLLSSVSPAERAEALQYYNDYFNDAGHENEGEVMEALGSPAKVAEMIKSGLNEKAIESGEYTETGFKNGAMKSDEMIIREQAYQKQYNRSSTEEKTKTEKKQMSAGTILLIVIIAVVSFPIWFPIISAFFVTFIGLFIAILGIVIGFGIGGVVLVVASVILLLVGIIRIFTGPLSGIILIGASFLLAGIGILLCLLASVFCFRVIPILCKGIIHLIGLPFKNKGGQAA